MHIPKKIYNKDTFKTLSLIRRAKKGDSRAENDLVLLYMPYIEYMVSLYSKKTDIDDDDDLRSYIFIGFIEGVRNFKEGMNTRFIYYTHIWMKKHIFLGENKYHRFIRIPVNQKKFYDEFVSKMSEEEELELSYSDEDLLRYLTIKNTLTTDFSDFEVTDSDSGEYKMSHSFLYGIANEAFIETERIEKNEVLRNNISAVLNKFSDKEIYILEHLFGLNNKEILNSRQIADSLGVTKVNIVFTRNRLIRTLRHNSLSRIILNGI